MRDGLFTRKFWADTAERAVVTAFQVGLATIPVTTTLVQEVRWDMVGGAAALGALLAVGKAVVASRIGRSDSASLVDPR